MNNIDLNNKTTRFFHRRVFIFLSFKIFLFIILISRLFYLQIIKNKYFIEKSNKNSKRQIMLQSKRGIIFDSSENILAESIDVYWVFIDLKQIKTPEFFFNKYERFLNITSDEFDFIKNEFDKIFSYQKKNNSNSSFYQSNLKNIIEFKIIQYEKILILKSSIKEYNEIFFIKKSIRLYPKNLYMSHIVGYLSSELKKNSIKGILENSTFQNGAFGFEKYFNDKLSGKNKIVEIRVNAYSKKIDENIIDYGKNGDNFFSSINSNLHKLIYEYFILNDKNGAAVVSEFDKKTHSSKIIACFSSPGFNPNLFTESALMSQKEWERINNDKEKPLINKAISGLYPAGSIFKVFIGLAALEQKIINKDTKIFCDGGCFIGDRFYSCLGRHGSISIYDAIKFSCNTFFYSLAKNIDIDELYKFGLELGLGQISNLNFYGEKIGFLPSKDWKKKKFRDFWRIGDSANLMIGQGYLALSPLQFNSMMNSIAFGINSRFSFYADPSIDDSLNSIKISKISSKENLDIIRLAMFKSVNEYGGTSFSSIGSKYKDLKICGKTGTVQIFSKKNTGMNHSTFIGFMPFENPRFSVSIMGEYAGYGSQFAAPLAGEIFSFINKNIKY